MKATLCLPDDSEAEARTGSGPEHKKLNDAAGCGRPAKALKAIKLPGGPITTKEIKAAIARGRD